MEKYCKSCGRVFKDSDFKICPYCGDRLSTRTGRQPIPRKLRHQVFQRDGYRCRECGATNKQTRLHVDHIKPVAKGGTNDLSNLQTLCEECNRAKYTDEWIGGTYANNFKQNNVNVDKVILHELNRKQMEIKTARYACVKLVEEFNLCNDINIVSEKIGISAVQIKRWYKRGKNGDPKFEDFYYVLLNLNPNMDIKNDNYKNMNDNNNFKSFQDFPLEEQLSKVLSKLIEGVPILIISHIFDLHSNMISVWYSKGKNSNCEYTKFYQGINNFVPDIANEIEQNNKRRINQIIEENLDDLCRIYSIPKLGKTYVINRLINDYEVDEILDKLNKYGNNDYSSGISEKDIPIKKYKKCPECFVEVDETTHTCPYCGNSDWE